VSSGFVCRCCRVLTRKSELRWAGGSIRRSRVLARGCGSGSGQAPCWRVTSCGEVFVREEGLPEEASDREPHRGDCADRAGDVSLGEIVESAKRRGRLPGPSVLANRGYRKGAYAVTLNVSTGLLHPLIDATQGLGVAAATRGRGLRSIGCSRGWRLGLSHVQSQRPANPCDAVHEDSRQPRAGPTRHPLRSGAELPALESPTVSVLTNFSQIVDHLGGLSGGTLDTCRLTVPSGSAFST
jgi:hypothetical protein